MSLLSHERLKQLLNYDPLTGYFTWKVRRNQHAGVGDRAGYVSPANGYRYINIRHKLHLAHRLAVFYMTGEWPSDDVDHKHGDRDDNRWELLRGLSRAGNMQNLQGAHRDSRTGLLGVVPCRSRFAAQIRAGGRNRHLGTFDTAEEAHQAYLKAKRELHPAGTI